MRPHTGRRHQVRAHLAAIGLPLVGDPLYRARNFGPGLLPPDAPPVERTLLHAQRLEFEHPARGGRVAHEVEPPPDFRALRDFLRAHLPAGDPA